MSKEDEPAVSLTEEELLEKLRDGRDNEDEILWDLATLCAKSKRPTMALSYLDRLINKCEKLSIKVIWYMKMGIFMEEVKDYESAIVCYSRVFSLKPTMDMNRYFMNNNIGYCLNQLGKYPEAELCCREAIKIDPIRHNAYTNLGVSLEGQRKYQQAAECYSKATMLYPQDFLALKHFEALWGRIRKNDLFI